MNQEDYIEQRVDNQLHWYSAKSMINKKMHLGTRGLVIIFSAFIPFAAGFSETHPDHLYLNYLIGVLGMLVAIIAGVSALMKYQEKWVKYRSTAEALNREKYMFMTLSGNYQDEKDPFHLLVTRVENIIALENTMWSEFMNEDEKI